MSKEQPKQAPPTPVRISEELRIWLKHRAVDNRRSLNQEIAARLEESRRQEEAHAKPQLRK